MPSLLQPILNLVLRAMKAGCWNYAVVSSSLLLRIVVSLFRLINQVSHIHWYKNDTIETTYMSQQGNNTPYVKEKGRGQLCCIRQKCCHTLIGKIGLAQFSSQLHFYQKWCTSSNNNLTDAR